MKQRIRVIVLGGAVFALTSCQNFPNWSNRSTNNTIVEGATAPPARAAEAEESRISTLKADNARLERQLAGALKENIRLKKDLAELRDDNSLLNDLAAKKQR